MDKDKQIYFKISVIVISIFFIWLFGSFDQNNFTRNSPSKTSLRNKPAALENFSLPDLAIFKDSENLLPKRNWSVPPLELSAEAAIAVKLDGSRIYYNKNIKEKRHIASLTKLMTAIVVLENYNLDEAVKIEKKYLKREGEIGDLRPGESITARSLLDIMLINSSNDAAFSLSEQKPDFINLMNKKAKELNLTNTHFVNPDGLDEQNNYSSAMDIAKIFSYLISDHFEILEVLKTKNMVVYSSDGKIEHRLINTNELLGVMPEIKAGKTGYTDEAGGSLALLISDINFGDKNDIITVVLGSNDRFGESEKLINWLKKAYLWR